MRVTLDEISVVGENGGPSGSGPSVIEAPMGQVVSTLTNLLAHGAFGAIVPVTAMSGYAKRIALHIEVRHLLDTTTVASAQNFASSLNRTTGGVNDPAVLPATTGSILPGAPRNVVGGLKLSF